MPQVYAYDVKVGQDVTTKLVEAQGKTVSAKVDHVAGALDPVSRSRQVDVSLPNKYGLEQMGFTPLSKNRSAFLYPCRLIRAGLSLFPLFVGLGLINNRFVSLTVMAIFLPLLLYFSRMLVLGDWAF